MFASKDIFLKSTGGYTISRSVRLRSSASAYLNRTPASAGSQTTWTMSLWVKRGALGTRQFITMSGVNPNPSQVWQVEFDASDKLSFYNQTINIYRLSTRVFRDPSAWYHLVFGADTNNATAQNRFRCWVNGVEITAWDTNSTIASGYTFAYNGAYLHGIGAYTYSGNIQPLDGYLTEVNFIDGQALTPSSFGQTNGATGVWQPAKYTGTYGTNGFYLNFSSNSTAAALGTDFSGNSNTWTVNNISVTAGTTYDSMTDVPTLTSATAANYPTWNPLQQVGLATFTEANLKAVSTSVSAPNNIVATMAMPTTGKWYCEVTAICGAGSPMIGIANINSGGSYAAYRTTGVYVNSISGASSSGTPSTYTTNDVIGIAYDADAGTLNFYKNGVAQSGGFTSVFAIGEYAFMVRKDSASGDGGYLNCGQRPFSYTAPTGFVALNTYNLPTSTITNGAGYMAATLWSGQNTALSITNSGAMQPDFVWIKKRNGATDHNLTDSVRGSGKNLISNSTAAEDSVARLTSFDSGGFTLAGAYDNTNLSGSTYVGWQWQAGKGSSSSNTNGSITSTVSVNATAGFSVVTYTGTGANATVGHGLGVAPKFIIAKARGTPNGIARPWYIYHTTLGASAFIYLDSTSAAVTGNTTVWQGVTPTSSVFSLGTEPSVNWSGSTYVAYCWSEVAGYSKFGSYTGNGSTDGPFVYLGFRPRFVLIKETDAANQWVMLDTSRDTYNYVRNELQASASVIESVNRNIDFTANGFKIREGAAGPAVNASGNTYIYAAFAENPFKNALAR